MGEGRTAQLYEEKAARDFYEDRYRQGYMDEWPDEKKGRIAEVIRSLPLPPGGEALDFGCGNGVLTTILRRALPGDWKVAGSDISSVAIANARSRFPDCEFFTADDPAATGRTFDLLLTHHVLEHVSDLEATLGIMDSLVKDRGAMLHILPCGNPGSFEHCLAANRAGGIDPEMQGRFFFEDEGHVRRLTTDALAERLASRGFRLAGEWYANQHDAAIDWITRSPREFVRDIADPDRAVDATAARELAVVRRRLLAIRRWRERAEQYRYRLRQSGKSWKNYLYLLVHGPAYLPAAAIDRLWTRRAAEEWRRCHERNGSEMYLFFRREAARA